MLLLIYYFNFKQLFHLKDRVTYTHTGERESEEERGRERKRERDSVCDPSLITPHMATTARDDLVINLEQGASSGFSICMQQPKTLGHLPLTC